MTKPMTRLVLAFLAVAATTLGCGSDKAKEGIPDLNFDFKTADVGLDLPHDGVAEIRQDAQGETLDLLEPVDLTPEVVVVCTPGERQCQNLLTPAQCNESGTAWIPLNQCTEGFTCYAATGSCAQKICQPSSRECLDGANFHICLIDGSGWGPTQTCEAPSTCSNGLCISPGCLPKVMFLVDRSTSMGPNWEAVRNSINAVVQQNPGIHFGLTVFPSEDGFFAGCTMEPDQPHIPIQANAAGLLDAWFDDNEPAGATPLLTAMKWIKDNVSLCWGAAPENSYLVLLSDGEDKCTCSEFEDDPEARAECVAEKLIPVVQNITSQGVKTFVIGYAYSGPDIELKVIAENGGTTYTDWIYAGSEQTLTDAFGKLIDDVKWCM